MVGMLPLMRQRQAQVVHGQPGVDAENTQRLATVMEVLMQLKNGNREHVECVEVEFLIFDDHLALAADDKIDLVVKMTMRSRALAWRDFRHNDAERFAMAADARIDDISKIAHRRRFEN